MAYRLKQTGSEIQELLDKIPQIEDGLTNADSRVSEVETNVSEINEKVADLATLPLKKGEASGSVVMPGCTASAMRTIALGLQTTASGLASHAEGRTTSASGSNSHAEGLQTTASGQASYAEGNSTTASGNFSHAEGYNTTASGDKSHAEGDGTAASGSFSHAEGSRTEAGGISSHAEGFRTEAVGTGSHAEGNGTTASGISSHAEGSTTRASSNGSHAEGGRTLAINKYEHAEGTYNLPIQDKTIHTVGIGSSDTNRVNAHEIHKDGKHYIFGIGGYDGTNSQTEGVKTVQEAVNGKQDKLTAGAGIEISQDNTITCTLDPTVFVVVDSLPTAPEAANINKIHLVKDTAVEGNLYSEYLYVNNTWEKLGDFRPSVGLSDYARLNKSNTFTSSQFFKNGLSISGTLVLNSGINDSAQRDIVIQNLQGAVSTPKKGLKLRDSYYSNIPIYGVEVPDNAYDDTCAVNKAYVDNLISQMQTTIDALTHKVEALENIISQTAVQE